MQTAHSHPLVEDAVGWLLLYLLEGEVVFV